MSIEDVTATYGQLTGIVTYHTQYTDANGTAIKLSGAEVAVNAIISLPTLRNWQASIDIGKDMFVSTSLNLAFLLIYKGADSGLSATVKFDKEEFIRPRPVTAAGRAFVVHTDDATMIHHVSRNSMKQPTTTPAKDIYSDILKRRTDQISERKTK